MDIPLNKNSIILFLEEAVSFVAMYYNLSWEPPVCLWELIPPPVHLFRQSIGRAITHHCMEELFSRYEPEWSLLSGIEAATYIQNYLRALMEATPNENYYTCFCFVSFICHLCVHAIRTERYEIVTCIVMEAAVILYSRCNNYMDFFQLIQASIFYSSQHRQECNKIAEDYCEIKIFESLEIIQLDIEDINQQIETTEYPRLPQIPLPEFSGVIAEFSNFKNQFINLISNEQLNDSQKLYYLRASLKGEAKLSESPSDSFDSLFKALEDRYENKRQLIDSHVLEIINYEKIYSESAKELRALMDCINRNIRALKVLKYEQNDLSDIILINIILHKIDKESRKQFELSLKTAEVPTFDSIVKFLEKRSAVLENITRIPSTKMIHKNTAMSTKAKSLVVNSKKITVKSCILCRNSHPLYKCIAFQNMSVECRKKFVTNNKLCINCLRLHYGACMSKYKCTVSGCKGLHNSLLHDSAELCSAVKNHTVGERGIESNSNPTRFEGQPEVAVLTYGNKCVLLNTFSHDFR
ncbi:DUF1758 domain-containing protein [Trichonephila clavipes]|nr:DUF1758 domain-containing protein [Trichonephila clavipes]